MINKKTVYIILTLILLMLSSVSAFAPTFRDYTLGTSSAGSEDVKCGDINGDGLNEVVSIHFTATQLRTSKNLGGFLPKFTTASPFGVTYGGLALDDWDGDDDLDMVAGDTNLGRIYVYANNGGGTFTEILSHVTGDLVIEDIVLTDIDEDGDLDVMYVSDGGVKYLVRQGVYGIISTRTVNSSGGSRGLDVGDYDNDGDLDVLGCGGTAINLNTQVSNNELSPATLTFEGRLLNNSLNAQVEDCKFTDLNNDGYLDIVYSANNRVGYMRNNHPLGFGNPVDIAVVIGTTTLAIEDYNDDGLQDIVFPSDTVELYLNLGDFNFNAYTIANFGGDVAVGCDINNDNFIDVVEMDDSTIRYHLNTDGFCVEPAIFCDDFEEDTPLTSRDWDVINLDNSMNQSFKGNGTNLLWNTSDPFKIGYYDVEPFTVDYDLSESEKINSSVYAPLFSVEFEILIDNTTNNTRVQFDTFDERNRLGTSLQFRVSETIVNVNWFNGTYENIGTFTPNVYHKIKVEEYFGDKDDYSFNSTFNFNEVKIYVDNVEITDEYVAHRVDPEYLSTYQVFISKDQNQPVTMIDNYYHFIGNDRFTNNNDKYYQDYFVLEDSVLQSGDFIDTVDSFWDILGLRSQGSKTLFGLIFLVVTILVIVGVFLGTSHGNTAGLGLTVGVYAIVYTVLAVFIGLFPVWILILFGIMGAGAIALGIALKVDGGG